MAASHNNLDNLTVLVDWNGIQLDGRNDDIMKVSPIDDKFRSFGWDTCVIDGHDVKAIAEALDKARQHKGSPFAIIAKTKKGKGVSFMEDTNAWHGKAPDSEQIKQAVTELGDEW